MDKKSPAIMGSKYMAARQNALEGAGVKFIDPNAGG